MRMEMSLLDTGVQLMTHPETSFLTMNATPFRCCFSSPENHILCPSSVVVSPKPVHLTSHSPMISHRYLSSSQVSSCNLPGAYRVRTFHVPIDIPCVGSLMVFVAPVVDLSRPPWSESMGRAVVVDPGPDRSGMSMLSFLLVMSFQWACIAQWRPSPLRAYGRQSRSTGYGVGRPRPVHLVVESLWRPFRPGR